MRITRSEKFYMYDSHLCRTLRSRAREEGDKIAVRLFNSLICPTPKMLRGQRGVDVSPRSLWQWHNALKDGLCLNGVGPADKAKLAMLVQEDDA